MNKTEFGGKAQMPCPRCGGTGSVMNPAAIGAHFRETRKAKGYSVRSLAKRVGISAAYLSDLELGRRGWNDAIRKRLDRAVRVAEGSERP